MLIGGTGGYTSSFLTAADLLVIGTVLSFTLEGKRAKKPVIQGDATLYYDESN